MDTRTARLFTPTRVITLAVIAVVVLGLAYFRFAPGASPVSVPAGAKAGALSLNPCSYVSENRSYAADCGTLVVPENPAVPGSRLIALPVTRVHAQSDHSAEPIFYLEGGPGLTNTTFEQAGRFAGDRDVVLVGYRGVDGSVRLACPEVVSAMRHEGDALSNASMETRTDAFAARAKRSGGPEDRALYRCGCGYAFRASVSTTVGCPRCGTTQAW